MPDVRLCTLGGISQFEHTAPLQLVQGSCRSPGNLNVFKELHSNLLADLQPNSNGLPSSSNGLQPNSKAGRHNIFLQLSEQSCGRQALQIVRCVQSGQRCGDFLGFLPGAKLCKA